MGYLRARGKKKHLYVTFTYQGKHEEPTEYFCEKNADRKCNCRGCKSARGFLAELEASIAKRTFRYQDFFPESKFLDKLGVVNTAPNIAFGVYARTWLEYQESVLTYSTFRNYKKLLNQLLTYFDEIPIKDIKPIHVKSFISTLTIAPKSIQNLIGVLSVVLNSAIDDEIIDKNPCVRVKRPKVIKSKPNPFNLDEVISILDWMDEHKPMMTVFFAISFFTGMRTGEVMALKWSDINWNDYTITVQRTMTHGKIKESTKTAASRTIDIIEPLEPYLRNHKKYSYMKSDYIVISHTGEPYTAYENIKRSYYLPVLKALGLNERPLYHTRHTFTVLMLKAGEELAWIRDMLGHADLKQLVERYGNWINKSNERKGRKFISQMPTRHSQTQQK